MLTLENSTRPAASGRLLSISELHALLFTSRSDDGCDTRSTGRFSFFTPVTLHSLIEPARNLSAFTRDLSRGGVGLLHNYPIERGLVSEVLFRCRDVDIRKPAEAAWCRPAGEGWYLSGWRFLAETALPEMALSKIAQS